MPTVIDSLVVELGLDPRKFTEGQKAALAAFKKTQSEMMEQAKKTEAATQRLLNFFKSTASALGFAFSARALVQFAENVTTANAALDRSARLLGTTSTLLATWRGAAYIAGGTAQGFQQSVGALVSEFQNFALTGQSSVIPYFRALGIQVSDNTGRMRPFQDIMVDLADAFHNLDPARAAAFGKALGFDEGTVNLLIKGGDAVRQLVRDTKNLTTVTDEDRAASQQLESAWRKLETGASNLGNKIVTALTPALVDAMDWLGDIFKFAGIGADRANRGRSRLHAGAGEKGGDVTDLRAKAGVGNASVGVAALASSLQGSIPGLSQFTAFDDAYHKGTGSQHEKGLALDFTIKDPKQAAEVAAEVRKQLSARGVNATVLDEYNHPSKNSTGGHIHVSFANQTAADRFVAGAGTASRVDRTTHSTSTSTTSEVNINEINVNAPGADSKEIARNVADNIRLRAKALNFQGGSQ